MDLSGPEFALGFVVGAVAWEGFHYLFAVLIDRFFTIDPSEPTPIGVDESRKD